MARSCHSFGLCRSVSVFLTASLWLKQTDYWCSHSSVIKPPPAHFLCAEPQSGRKKCVKNVQHKKILRQNLIKVTNKYCWNSLILKQKGLLSNSEHKELPMKASYRYWHVFMYLISCAVSQLTSATHPQCVLVCFCCLATISS